MSVVGTSIECDDISEDLAKWPGLGGIVSLNISCVCGGSVEQYLPQLLRSPYLSPRLRKLDLSCCCQLAGNIELLVNCPALEGLGWLGFGWNGLNSSRIKMLLQSPHLRHLEALHMSSMREDGELAALQELTQTTSWPRLRDVVIGSDTNEQAMLALRNRFGARLRVWGDC